MRILFSPRLWLMIWLGIGATALLYVILAAALSGNATKIPSSGRLGAVLADPNLQKGEMARFVYAAEPRTAPSVAFFSERGELSLDAFRGRVTLVNFWATWCGPCLRELPSLEALEAALGGEEFEVVAIAADPKGPEAAREFLDKLKIENLELYVDPKLSMVIAAGGSAVLPLSILYDARGREIGRFVGEADWNSADAKALIRAAIENSKG